MAAQLKILKIPTQEEADVEQIIADNLPHLGRPLDYVEDPTSRAGGFFCYWCCKVGVARRVRGYHLLKISYKGKSYSFGVCGEHELLHYGSSEEQERARRSRVRAVPRRPDEEVFSPEKRAEPPKPFGWKPTLVVNESLAVSTNGNEPERRVTKGAEKLLQRIKNQGRKEVINA